MKTSGKVFLILFLICVSVRPVLAQCCSSGSPVGASTHIGILDKNTLRVIAFYRHNYSDTYFQGSEKSPVPGAVKKMDFNYTGFTLAYGITHRFTLETDMGYFLNKTQQFKTLPTFTPQDKNGYGFSNGNLTLKYCFFNRPSQNVEITGGLGVKYALGTAPMFVNNVELPIDVQPSTHAFGINSQLFLNKGWPEIGVRVFSFNKFEYNFQNDARYQYGTSLINSVFVSKKIIPYFFFILQVRNEFKARDLDHNPDPETKKENGKLTNTGDHILYISPQLSYSILKTWHLAVLVDLPVYKNYYGENQLTPGYSFALSLSRDFARCFSKE